MLNNLSASKTSLLSRKCYRHLLEQKAMVKQSGEQIACKDCGDSIEGVRHEYRWLSPYRMSRVIVGRQTAASSFGWLK